MKKLLLSAWLAKLNARVASRSVEVSIIVCSTVLFWCSVPLNMDMDKREALFQYQRTRTLDLLVQIL